MIDGFSKAHDRDRLGDIGLRSGRPDTLVVADAGISRYGHDRHGGKVFVAALDGRLIALDAATGKEVWVTETVEPGWLNISTGAPRVFKGKVIIGNGGADFGARGYVTAYDANTGKQAWRFFTTPGTAEQNKGDAAMEAAANKGYATATDLADYLVKKGLPFRDAHETVAHAVKAATSHNCDLSELPLTVLQGFHASIGKDVYEVLSLRGSLSARNTLGGTAPAQVRAQIARHRARLG